MICLDIRTNRRMISRRARMTLIHKLLTNIKKKARFRLLATSMCGVSLSCSVIHPRFSNRNKKRHLRFVSSKQSRGRSQNTWFLILSILKTILALMIIKCDVRIPCFLKECVFLRKSSTNLSRSLVKWSITTTFRTRKRSSSYSLCRKTRT